MMKTICSLLIYNNAILNVIRKVSYTMRWIKLIYISYNLIFV